MIALLGQGHAGVGEHAAHPLAGATIGYGDDDGVARARERPHAAHEALLAAGDLGTTSDELGVDRATRAHERHQREALALAELELARRHVQAVEVDLGRLGQRLELLSAADGVVEERARLGDHDERLGREVLGGDAGALVEQRQVLLDAVEVDALLDELEVMGHERVGERGWRTAPSRRCSPARTPSASSRTG